MVTDRLVILGAMGDLTGRYLLPALCELFDASEEARGLTVVGVSREDLDDDAFREHAAQQLSRHAAGADAGTRSALVQSFRYVRADVTDPKALRPAIEGTDGCVIVYLALPPQVFAPALQALADAGLPSGSRIVVEKPFGESLAEARALNDLLHTTFPENAVFRVDHFLGLQTVQNLLGLRFGNRLFEPLWSCQHVERVEVVFDETLALEGRAGYYDHAGALKDMIQNHLLQLLCLVAIEPPLEINERDLRDRKVDVLRAVRKLHPDEVDRLTKRARYTSGSVNGVSIPSYADEPGVDAARATETFAEVTLFVDNWRWTGVPFVMRSGKALGSDRHEISVWFRHVPHRVFGTREPGRNVLRFGMSPDQLALDVNLNGAGDVLELEHAQLRHDLVGQIPSAYARVLLDVIRGDSILSIRDDEAEESWRIMEPIVQRWSQGSPPLLEYAAGTTGPS